MSGQRLLQLLAEAQVHQPVGDALGGQNIPELELVVAGGPVDHPVVRVWPQQQEAGPCQHAVLALLPALRAGLNAQVYVRQRLGRVEGGNVVGVDGIRDD